MCPIKNLLTKRSTRNLRDPALSPYPPNIFPFKPESEAEIRHESISDFIEPQRKPKRESEKSSKSKRDSKIVLPPRLLPLPLPFVLIPPIELTLVTRQPKPYYRISQEVYTGNELLSAERKTYWISKRLWREQEQTWWYLLMDGVRPDGLEVGWVAEAALRAAKMEGMVLC